MMNHPVEAIRRTVAAALIRSACWLLEARTSPRWVALNVGRCPVLPGRPDAGTVRAFLGTDSNATVFASAADVQALSLPGRRAVAVPAVVAVLAGRTLAPTTLRVGGDKR